MRRCYLLLSTLLFLTISLPLFGQTQKVTGVIKDESDTPVEYANVILAADNSDKVNAILSQSNGSFQIVVSQNKYKFTVSMFGYDTYTSEVEVNGASVDLGVIVLKESVQQLGDVVVTAKLIDRKADRVRTFHMM